MTLKSLIRVASAIAAVISSLTAEEIRSDLLVDKILGNQSCATSGCHGGSGPLHGTLSKFNATDIHARSFATLATPRSARMGEALGIGDVTTSPSCTACHAPAAGVPAAMRGEDLRIGDGVGCASCHESSDTWLRSHTRPDLDHAQKVAAGMRDLRSTYARANACVACHQVIQPRLVETGRHPRLIFELDGMIATEPRHWREVHGWDGAKAWFVGQAVAWREAAAARSGGRDDSAGAAERERALSWLVRRAGGATSAGRVDFDAKSGEADAYARNANESWQAADGEKVLRDLAKCAGEFRNSNVKRLEQAYRAERLVLGLDRLLASWPERVRATACGPALDRLFTTAQSVPDFAPPEFANRLEDFAKAVGGE
ncbi:hypothetical protein IMCC26134_09090 [Verrucomicrobia bacterium IMCC26134]|nr:hypothetical protein IMCC26134_09090 [Verrucomicrobia bacterium IMCC26134]